MSRGAYKQHKKKIVWEHADKNEIKDWWKMYYKKATLIFCTLLVKHFIAYFYLRYKVL